MGLFSGLEKFGLKSLGQTDIYKEEKAEVKKQEAAKKAVEEPKEEDFILVKTVRCPVCDKQFKTKMVKSGRVKRLEPDFDLRPRQAYIDSLKYGISSCPNCGYTSLNRYFERITMGQIRLIQENICKNFKADHKIDDNILTSYDEAIDLHKLSLYTAMIKRARTSEKAYNCLILSWLYREKALLEKGDSEESQKKKAEYKAEEANFYKEAYDGLLKAVSSEMFPICGMDQCTMDYLLANMSFSFQEYETASKCLSNVITAPNASSKIKDKALELKDKVLAEMKKNKAK